MAATSSRMLRAYNHYHEIAPRTALILPEDARFLVRKIQRGDRYLPDGAEERNPYTFPTAARLHASRTGLIVVYRSEYSLHMEYEHVACARPAKQPRPPAKGKNLVVDRDLARFIEVAPH